jgi:hypothetical protein
MKEVRFHMESVSEIADKLKRGCRINPPSEAEKDVGFHDPFNRDWEVFVIKKDETTGKFVTKLACCAEAPV